GVLGIGGIICMIFGALFLVDGPIPEMRVRFLTAAAVSVPIGVIAIFLMTLVLRARRNRVVTGQEGMIGEIGVARTALGPDGKVFAHVDRMQRISLRQEAFEVPPQDIITRDNVTLKVNAVVFLRVIEPRRAVVEVFDYRYQTSQFAQTTLRSVLGEVELDELLAHR